MITCCQMTEAHKPEVLRLLNLFFNEDEYYLDSSTAYGGGGNAALQQALDLFSNHPELGFVWVAADEQGIAGVCVVCIAISTSAGGMVAKLDDVYVPAGRQNQGVGSMLMSSLFQELKSRGLFRIDTSVHHDNTGAERFYLRHGFKPLNEERLSLLL